MSSVIATEVEHVERSRLRPSVSVDCAAGGISGRSLGEESDICVTTTLRRRTACSEPGSIRSNPCLPSDLNKLAILIVTHAVRQRGVSTEIRYI
jgi:hypothetical protein